MSYVHHTLCTTYIYTHVHPMYTLMYTPCTPHVHPMYTQCTHILFHVQVIHFLKAGRKDSHHEGQRGTTKIHQVARQHWNQGMLVGGAGCEGGKELGTRLILTCHTKGYIRAIAAWAHEDNRLCVHVCVCVCVHVYM